MNRITAPNLPGDSRKNFGYSEADDDGNKNHQKLEQAHYCSLTNE
jgi:hypothetical protein